MPGPRFTFGTTSSPFLVHFPFQEEASWVRELYPTAHRDGFRDKQLSQIRLIFLLARSCRKAMLSFCRDYYADRKQFLNCYWLTCHNNRRTCLRKQSWDKERQILSHCLSNWIQPFLKPVGFGATKPIIPSPCLNQFELSTCNLPRNVSDYIPAPTHTHSSHLG